MLDSKKHYFPFLPYTLSGLLVGIYILISGSLSVAWNIVLISVLFTSITLLMSKDWLRLLLFFVILSLPIGLSKTLVEHNEIFVPGLIVQLSDLFVSSVLFFWVWKISIKEQKFPHRYKINTQATFIISWFAITIINAPMPALGVFEWITLFKSFLFFLFISTYFSKKKCKFLSLGTGFFCYIPNLFCDCSACFPKSIIYAGNERC